jgi:hypothetical protein
MNSREGDEIVGRDETREEYVQRMERRHRQRVDARNREETRICHHLAPTVGAVAGLYGFMSEHAVMNRLSGAALYFAVGWVGIWATALVNRTLRAKALTHQQRELYGHIYQQNADRHKEGRAEVVAHRGEIPTDPRST